MCRAWRSYEKQCCSNGNKWELTQSEGKSAPCYNIYIYRTLLLANDSWISVINFNFITLQIICTYLLGGCWKPQWLLIGASEGPNGNDIKWEKWKKNVN